MTTNKLVIEETNFRVDSTGWKEEVRGGIKIKVSPATDRYHEGEITELLEWPFKGEQHFTWYRAMAEVIKVGKRLLTKEEWETLIADREIDNIPLVGRRRLDSNYYYNQNKVGYYWTSSSEGSYSYIVDLDIENKNISFYKNCWYIFSVRCLKKREKTISDISTLEIGDRVRCKRYSGETCTYEVIDNPAIITLRKLWNRNIYNKDEVTFHQEEIDCRGFELIENEFMIGDKIKDYDNN